MHFCAQMEVVFKGNAMRAKGFFARAFFASSVGIYTVWAANASS
jgi:hypothetical protein